MTTKPTAKFNDWIEKIDLYARGPLDILEAWKEVPEAAQHFRPDAASWTAHEIVCHCADSEISASTRIRMLVAEPNPTIAGYDQDLWTTEFSYAELKVETALAVITAVRRWTVPILKQLTDTQWASTGTHTESGPYSAVDWLDTYSVHLRDHAEQIRANITAYENQRNRGK